MKMNARSIKKRGFQQKKIWESFCICATAGSQVSAWAVRNRHFFPPFHNATKRQEYNGDGDITMMMMIFIPKTALQEYLNSTRISKTHLLWNTKRCDVCCKDTQYIVLSHHHHQPSINHNTQNKIKRLCKEKKICKGLEWVNTVACFYTKDKLISNSKRKIRGSQTTKNTGHFFNIKNILFPFLDLSI